MSVAPAAHDRPIFCFGPFKLHAKERLLVRDGEVVALGSRALDLLIVLVTTHAKVLTKRDLIARVWPDVFVDEGSLRVQIGAIRRALGDNDSDAPYIKTVASRGYCFVAPVTVSLAAAQVEPRAAVSSPSLSLPPRLPRMIGRDSTLAMLATLLAEARFVTITGLGGVGKTTLAVAVAHEMLPAFEGAVTFVDLAAVSDPCLVASAVASTLGLAVQSDDLLPGLIAYLRHRRILIILDNCEHVIEAAATLAAGLFAAAPQVHLIATSREALRVEGEQVCKAAPFAVPPDEPGLTAESALSFSAVQLFVDRAAAGGAKPLDLTNADALIVSEICRRVDGLALAIELVAGRVGAYGLPQILALLDQGLTMRWRGHRGAPPRQQTLRAVLHWSYELLSEVERAVLRRLAVFAGPFTLNAALAIVTDETLGRAPAFDAMDRLVAKSLLMTSATGSVMRFRLPETTRAYALEIEAPDRDRAELAASHARYYLVWLRQVETDWQTQPSASKRAILLAEFGNVRAALEWCFGSRGDVGFGVDLACAAVPLFLALSLLTECRRWSERALAACTGAGEREMLLEAAVAMSAMFAHRNSPTVCSALTRSLAIARKRKDAAGELRALSLLHLYYRRTGDHRNALKCAKRCSATAEVSAETSAVALGHSLLGVSLYHTGDLNASRAELEAALALQVNDDSKSTVWLGFDHFNLAAGILSRTLWLRGHPAQAVERARATLRDAERTDHPLTLAIASVWALSVLLWVGDLERADELVTRSLAHAEAHSLIPHVLQARGFRGELALRHGDAEGGIQALHDCLKDLRVSHFGLQQTRFSISLAEALVDAGRSEDALPLLEQALAIAKKNGEFVYMPELLRVSAKARVIMPSSSGEDAEALFLQSLRWGRRQAARSWQLRTAMDLATLWRSQDRPDAARSLLQPIRDGIAEGRDTADLRAADQLLATLG